MKIGAIMAFDMLKQGPNLQNIKILYEPHVKSGYTYDVRIDFNQIKSTMHLLLKWSQMEHRACTFCDL